MKSDKWIMFGAGILLGILVGFFVPKMFSEEGAAPPPPPPLAARNVNQDETIKRLKGVLATDAGNYQAWVELGNAYYDANQAAPAVESYVKALAIDGSSPDVHTDLGNMYRNLGRFQESADEYRKARDLAPNHFQSRKNLGVVLLYDLKDYQGAIDAWEDALKIQSTGEQAESIKKQLDGLRRMTSQMEEARKAGKPMPQPGIPGAQPSGDMALPPVSGAK